LGKVFGHFNQTVAKWRKQFYDEEFQANACNAMIVNGIPP
jgi:hypothetical protein